MAMFRKGFNPALKYKLNLVKADNFEDLVNIALNDLGPVLSLHCSGLFVDCGCYQQTCSACLA